MKRWVGKLLCRMGLHADELCFRDVTLDGRRARIPGSRCRDCGREEWIRCE